MQKTAKTKTNGKKNHRNSKRWVDFWSAEWYNTDNSWFGDVLSLRNYGTVISLGELDLSRYAKIDIHRFILTLASNRKTLRMGDPHAQGPYHRSIERRTL